MRGVLLELRKASGKEGMIDLSINRDRSFVSRGGALCVAFRRMPRFCPGFSPPRNHRESHRRGAPAQLAAISGGGSQERKVALINGLISAAGANKAEARFAVRAVQGKLRIGLAEVGRSVGGRRSAIARSVGGRASAVGSSAVGFRRSAVAHSVGVFCGRARRSRRCRRALAAHACRRERTPRVVARYRRSQNEIKCDTATAADALRAACAS